METRLLLWFHPAAQTLVLGVALNVLALGWKRLRMAHLGARGLAFDWPAHVLRGKIALTALLFGFAGGLGTAWLHWGEALSSGLHARVGLAMLPVIAFSLGSGLYMDRARARRTALPLAHGLAGVLVVLLGLWQLSTGASLLRDMLSVPG